MAFVGSVTALALLCQRLPLFLQPLGLIAKKVVDFGSRERFIHVIALQRCCSDAEVPRAFCPRVRLFCKPTNSSWVSAVFWNSSGAAGRKILSFFAAVIGFMRVLDGCAPGV